MTPETRIDRLTAALENAREVGFNSRETAIAILAAVDSLDAEHRAQSREADIKSCQIIARMMQLGDIGRAMDELHVAIRRNMK